jgi:hypothetical protein
VITVPVTVGVSVVMAWPTVALILVCGYAGLPGLATTAVTVICTVAVVKAALDAIDARTPHKSRMSAMPLVEPSTVGHLMHVDIRSEVARQLATILRRYGILIPQATDLV